MNIALLKSVMQDILGQIDHKFIDKEVEYFKVSFSKAFSRIRSSDEPLDNLVNFRTLHLQQKIWHFGFSMS